jgi:hypothetical protein
MMGFPCLRLNRDFFACWDPRSGNLVIKLDEPQVGALIDAGKAEAFAPNGRRFREWAAIPVDRHRSWRSLLEQALQASAARRASQRQNEALHPRLTLPSLHSCWLAAPGQDAWKWWAGATFGVTSPPTLSMIGVSVASKASKASIESQTSTNASRHLVRSRHGTADRPHA